MEKFVSRFKASNFAREMKNWKRLPADTSRFPTPVYTDGSAILIPACVATCFGGSSDAGDDGRTASGIRTDINGGVAGCALPMPTARACLGTPIAQLPWKTRVIIQMGEWLIEVPLIDVGPAGGLSTKAMVDLTPNAVASLIGLERLSPRLANSWQGTVSVLIPNVTAFMADYWPSGAGTPPPWHDASSAPKGLSV